MFRAFGILLIVVGITASLLWRFDYLNDQVVGRVTGTVGVLMAIYIGIGAWRARRVG